MTPSKKELGSATKTRVREALTRRKNRRSARLSADDLHSYNMHDTTHIMSLMKR
jgi:hypothetical protein